MNKVYLWVKKEPVLIISAICAVISMFFLRTLSRIYRIYKF